jgi:hypothetical protein
VILVAILKFSGYRYRIKRMILDRLSLVFKARQSNLHASEKTFTEKELEDMTVEEAEAELERLQKLIEDRKQIARDTDVSHHLWGLYKSLLRSARTDSLDRHIQDGEWYDVKILHVRAQNGLNRFEFELKGAKYKFVDDEEKQGWRENMKYFSLFLYDDADHCLIEIPMKMSVDSTGKRYSILSGGPKAFLSGGWVNDFIYVKLKQQRIRNQEIRAQKHRERLSEIEDLRGRFGILD